MDPISSHLNYSFELELDFLWNRRLVHFHSILWLYVPTLPLVNSQYSSLHFNQHPNSNYHFALAALEEFRGLDFRFNHHHFINQFILEIIAISALLTNYLNLYHQYFPYSNPHFLDYLEFN